MANIEVSWSNTLALKEKRAQYLIHKQAQMSVLYLAITLLRSYIVNMTGFIKKKANLQMLLSKYISQFSS